MQVQVAFYYSNTPASLIERLWTRRPGQPLAVPSHCALIINKVGVYEFVVTGFRRRDATGADLSCSIAVDVSDYAYAGLTCAVNACRGYSYSWGEVAAAAVNKVLPRRLKIKYRAVRGFDCSFACMAWLSAGGVDLGLADPSPNDVKAALLKRGEH